MQALYRWLRTNMRCMQQVDSASLKSREIRFMGQCHAILAMLKTNKQRKGIGEQKRMPQLGYPDPN